MNTKFAKLRTDFEKSEASRQTLEYELSLAKTNYNKEKQLNLEKEKMLEEISKNYQGTPPRYLFFLIFYFMRQFFFEF